MSNLQRIEIGKVRIDGGTQPRAEISLEVVADYAEAMQSGDEFPPVVIFHDGASYWLADGFHRYHAARRADLGVIEARVYDGDRREAILYSVGANHDHGYRRTNADKRRAVLTLLNDEKWTSWSDSEIARACKVHQTTVSRIRAEGLHMQSISEKPVPAPRTYRDRYGNESTMDTTNIGRPKKTAPASAHASPKPAQPIRDGYMPPRGTTVTLPHDPVGLAQALFSTMPVEIVLAAAEYIINTANQGEEDASEV